MVIIYKNRGPMFQKIGLAFKPKQTNAKTEKTRTAVSLIAETVNVLREQEDLSPNNQLVTDYLSALVKTLQESVENGFSNDLINDPDLLRQAPELRALCGFAECEMEKYWARQFIDEFNQNQRCLKKGDLQKFWYQAEYESLCKAEWEIISNTGNQEKIEQICFMGSGALPLTAILAAYEYPELKIKCVDIDKEACDLSKDLIAALGLTDRIEVVNQTAQEYKPSPKELIICASLLINKSGVYEMLFENGAEFMMVRDAESVYQFLYEPAQTPPEQFERLAQTQKTEKHINTSILYRIK